MLPAAITLSIFACVAQVYSSNSILLFFKKAGTSNPQIIVATKPTVQVSDTTMLP